MTKATLPEKAMSALAEHMGIKDVGLIEDVKTRKQGEITYLVVTIVREIDQTSLLGMVK